MRLRLKQLMEERGINQSQLAQALGIKAPSVNAWVTGKRTRNGQEVKTYPDFDSLDNLCAFFDVPPGEMLERETMSTPTGKTWRNYNREDDTEMGHYSPESITQKGCMTKPPPSTMPIQPPFLKWAGNKLRIVDRVRGTLPKGFRLIEPFVGSAAIALNTDFNDYLLSDANADLINLYQALQQDGPGLTAYCRTFFQPEHNQEGAYYAWRAEFNKTSDIRLKAALFVYLNRHSFNGLCRYNASGGFNAPFGRYKAPKFPEQELLGFAQKLKSANFVCQDFRETMQQAKMGDVVYCDPPYVPLSETSNFTAYSAGGFTKADQTDLAELAVSLASEGIPVLLSNHDTEWTRLLYKKAKLSFFDVQRYISRDGANRNKAKELLALFKG